MVETEEARLKRLKIRCWRRGIKEMDLILGRYADAKLATMTGPELDALEILLEENDWDLYYWVTGARAVPEKFASLVGRIAAFHGLR